MINATIDISGVTSGEQRSRRDYGDLAGLAASIKSEGLYHPIVVTSSGRLVAGERRLRACRDILGWTEIPARVVDDSTPVAAEYHENEHRKDLTAAERAAVVDRLRTEQSKTVAEAAAEAGTSRRTYFRQKETAVNRHAPSLKRIQQKWSRFITELEVDPDTIAAGSLSDREAARANLAQLIAAAQACDAAIADAPDPKPRKRRRRNRDQKEEPRSRPRISEEELNRRWESLNDTQRAKAERQAKVAARAEDLHARDGLPRKTACDLAAKGTDWSGGAIKNLIYGKNGEAGLADYPRHLWPLVLTPKHSGGSVEAECHPAAWEAFKTDYLRLEKPPLAMCFRNLQRLAAREGWTIPRSAAALKNRLERYMSPSAVILAREGAEALAKRRPAQIRERPERVMWGVNGDARMSDVFVRWPDGKIERPWLMAWQELYSSKILSWRIDRTENQDGYRLAFADMLRNFGIPEHVYMDNGRAFAAKTLTGGATTRYRGKIKRDDPVGLLTQLVGPEGIHWCKPYSGRSKPIERGFRDMASDIDKDHRLAGAYTGNKPDAKPENYQSKAIPLEEFTKVVESGIARHNKRPGRRGRGMEGRSFDEVFKAGYDPAAVARPTEAQLDRWLLAAVKVRAHADTGAVILLETRYWSEKLCEALAGRPAAQRDVVVRFDPERLDLPVAVEELDGTLISRAAPDGVVKYRDTQQARETARDVSRLKRSRREQLKIEGRMDERNFRRLIDEADAEEREAEAPPEQSNVQAGAFGKEQPRKRPKPVAAVTGTDDFILKMVDQAIPSIEDKDIGTDSFIREMGDRILGTVVKPDEEVI